MNTLKFLNEEDGIASRMGLVYIMFAVLLWFMSRADFAFAQMATEAEATQSAVPVCEATARNRTPDGRVVEETDDVLCVQGVCVSKVDDPGQLVTGDDRHADSYNQYVLYRQQVREMLRCRTDYCARVEASAAEFLNGIVVVE